MPVLDLKVNRLATNSYLSLMAFSHRIHSDSHLFP